MKKYRIIEHTYNMPKFLPNEGKVVIVTKSCYEAQKRFLGFLWWYNFNNIDGITTGIYDHQWEAEEAIDCKMKHNHSIKVVKEYN